MSTKPKTINHLDAPEGMHAIASPVGFSCIGCDCRGDLCTPTMHPCCHKGRADGQDVIFKHPRTSDAEIDRLAAYLVDIGFKAEDLKPDEEKKLAIELAEIKEEFAGECD